MSETRWTPGPLTTGGIYPQGAFGEHKPIKSGGEVVGYALCLEDSAEGDEISRSNARLWAAAPDLYEDGYVLAMAALQSDRYAEDPDYRDAVDNMLASLARARGEGPNDG